MVLLYLGLKLAARRSKCSNTDKNIPRLRRLVGHLLNDPRQFALITGGLLIVLPRLAGQKKPHSYGPKALPSSYHDLAEILPYKNLIPGATAGSVLK